MLTSDHTVVIQILRNAAKVISCHLSFTAVTVKGAHLGVGNFGGFYQNDSVSSDSEMRCAEVHAQRFGAGDSVVEILYKDIVVSAGMHFGKVDFLSPAAHCVDINELSVVGVKASGYHIGKGICRVKRGYAWNSQLHSATMKRYVISHGGILHGAGVNNVIKGFSFHQIGDLVTVRRIFDKGNRDPDAGNFPCRSDCRIKLDSEVIEAFGKGNDFLIIVFFNTDKNSSVSSVRRNLEAGGGKTFKECFRHVFSYSENFTGGFHFRSENRVGIV